MVCGSTSGRVVLNLLVKTPLGLGVGHTSDLSYQLWISTLGNAQTDHSIAIEGGVMAGKCYYFKKKQNGCSLVFFLGSYNCSKIRCADAVVELRLHACASDTALVL